MAERAGFEPAVHLYRAYNRLAGDRFRPLSHLSADYFRPVFLKQDVRSFRTHVLIAGGGSRIRPACAGCPSCDVQTRFKSQSTAFTFWRREQDSNPRDFHPTVFKTAAIDHSAIPPYHLIILSMILFLISFLPSLLFKKTSRRAASSFV